MKKRINVSRQKAEKVATCFFFKTELNEKKPMVVLHKTTDKISDNQIFNRVYPGIKK